MPSLGLGVGFSAPMGTADIKMVIADRNIFGGVKQGDLPNLVSSQFTVTLSFFLACHLALF